MKIDGDLAELLGIHVGDGCISENKRYSEYYLGGDLIEEREGKLYGYEFKWNKDKAKPPEDWLKTYKNASYEVINKENYFEFITY